MNTFPSYSFIVTVGLFISQLGAYAQSVGDYRWNAFSAGFDSLAAYQTYDGASWVAATALPGETSVIIGNNTNAANLPIININTGTAKVGSMLINSDPSLRTGSSWIVQTTINQQRTFTIADDFSFASFNTSGVANSGSRISFYNGQPNTTLDLLIEGNADIKHGTTRFGGGNTTNQWLNKARVLGTTTIDGALNTAFLNVWSPDAVFDQVVMTNGGRLSVFDSYSSNSSSGGITVAGLTGATNTVVTSRSINNIAGAAVSTGTLTIDGASGTTTFAGTLTNDLTAFNSVLALAKSGNSTQVLSGSNNTYSGGTTVNAGTLLVNNASGSGLGSGAVTVNGGVLGGSGAFTGAVTVNSGGTLAPGSSIESLTSGALAFNDGATFAYETDSSVALSQGADLQVVNGGLSLDGTVTLSLDNLAAVPSAFADGTVFTLLNYSGAWDGGLFTYLSTILANGDQFTFNSQQWEIEYNAVSGGVNFSGEYLAESSFVNITAVPEPSVWSLLLGGTLGLWGLNRLRSRKSATVSS